LEKKLNEENERGEKRKSSSWRQIGRKGAETEREKNVQRKRKAIGRRGYTEAVKPLEAENQSDVDPYSRNVKYSFGGIPI